MEKEAKDCGRADSVPEINRLLLAAYGISFREARNRLHHFRQKPEKNFFSFSARVERFARAGYGGMGSDIDNQMAVELFERFVEDPALRQHFIAGGLLHIG